MLTSTAIVMQLLEERRELGTPVNRGSDRLGQIATQFLLARGYEISIINTARRGC